MDPGYLELIGLTREYGRQVESRYGPTWERQGVTVKTSPCTFPRRPGLNPSIGILEGLFLVGCFYDGELIKKVAPNADLSLFTRRGAYGPRIHDQLMKVVGGLEADPTSRQHVLYVAHDGDQYSPDTPCTTSLQFVVRGGKISLHVAMRSSDIIKGLPTDLLQFGILLQVVAHCFEWEAELVILTAASSHLYEADLSRIPTANKLGRFRVQHQFEGTPMSRYVQYAGWARLSAVDQPWIDGAPRGIVRA